MSTDSSQMSRGNIDSQVCIFNGFSNLLCKAMVALKVLKAIIINTNALVV